MILLEEGRELYNSGKYEEAIKCFDKAKDVDICEILEEKCISLNYIGKYKEALKFADEAIEKCNGYENTLALAIKAEALSYIGNYLDAIANADEAISLSEKNKYEDLVCYSKFVKGYALDYHGKHDEAKECFDEVIQNKECQDEQVEALIGKGITLNYLGMTQKDKDKKNYNEAEKCFDCAIEILEEEDKKNISARYQDIAYAYINKSTTLYNLERNKEELDRCLTKALDYSNKSISRNPNDAHAWMIKGTYYLKLGFYEMAIQCYNKIIMDINREFDVAWCLKGYALNYWERYEGALKCFDEAIKINPNDPDYYMGKGISLHNLEKYVEAIECFDKVIDLEPAYRDTVNFLKGTSNYGKQRYNEALQNFADVDDKNVDDKILEAQKHNNIGACYYYLEKVEKARNEYEAATVAAEKSKANLAEPYFNLGVLYNDDGKIDKARNFFIKCLEADSSFTKAREALEKLDTQSPSSDWFRYWFSSGKAKKTFGMALVLSIFALISIVAATSARILYDNQNIALNSLDNQSRVSEFLNINQNILSSAVTGITIMIGLLIVILLLPSIRRIKVAEVELEPVPIDTKVPQHMDVLISKMRKVGMQSF